MAKGLRCAWAVFFHFHFRFIWFYLAYSLAGYFHAFSGKWVFFSFFSKDVNIWYPDWIVSLFSFFFLFLTHEAAFHYRSSGSFFHWLFSIYPLVIQLFQSSVCLFFFPFFSSLFPNQEAFPATKLYKDWLVLLLFSLSRFISIFGVDGRVFPFSLSWNFYSSLSIYTFTKRVGVC